MHHYKSKKFFKPLAFYLVPKLTFSNLKSADVAADFKSV